MWLTVTLIATCCGYLMFLFQRSRHFYLHSFFLVPLYPAIFFVDHNGHFLIDSLEVDSVDYVAKLVPLYLNALLLALRFKSRLTLRLSFIDVAVNAFLLYNVVLGVVYSFYHSSWLPLFYISFSVPLFLLFFNSRNFAEEVAAVGAAGAGEKRLLKLYFCAFVLIYAASIYYAIRSSITTSLLDSRGVGSIFASTSALVYCFMYAPLLAQISKSRWPHLVTIGIGVTSLSKTALLMLPGYGLMLYGRLKRNLVRNLSLYLIVLVLLTVLIPVLTPEDLKEEWEIKFALDSGETLLSKAYMTRLELYADALRIIHDAPFGIGVGNFELFSHDNYRDAHHFVLTVLSESGLLVGGLFILAVVAGLIRTLLDVARGRFTYWHFSLISVFLVYFFAGGVLQTTGTSEFSTIYYTPFYGVALLQLLNLTATLRLRLQSPPGWLPKLAEQPDGAKLAPPVVTL